MLHTYFIVLGGPISRRTAGHCILRHLETVRHDFFTHPRPTRTRVVSSVSSLFPFFLRSDEEGGLDADAKILKIRVIIILLAFRSTATSIGPSILGRKPPNPR